MTDEHGKPDKPTFVRVEPTNGKATYIMIQRKLIIAWIASSSIIFILVLGSYQYANYVARQMCGVISISNASYKKNPPSLATGQSLAKEFDKLNKKYHCK